MHLPPDNDIISYYENSFFESWPWDITRLSTDVDTRQFAILPMGFDESFSKQDYFEWTLYLRKTWWVPVVTALFYLVLVTFGQSLMKHRKPFDLRGPLAVWNFLLACFSIISTLKVVPYVLYTFLVNGPMYFLVRNPAMSFGQGGEMSYWAVLFMLSKYAELLDTAFLILRKKHVSTLHWYHHASVLLLSVQTVALHGPTGIIMVAMNIIVHSFMYSYYFLAAVMQQPPTWGRMITKLQILQMLLGTIMAISLFIVPRFVQNSCGVPLNNISILVVYMSYLVLFMQFYAKRYKQKAL